MIPFRAIVGIGVFIAVGLVVLAAFYYRGEARTLAAEKAQLTQQLADVKAVNAENVKTIERVTELRKQNDKLVLDVTKELQAINEAQTEATAAITELKENDIPAREYLNQPIPDSLKRLLNK